MTRARATAAPASPYGRRLRDSSSRSNRTTASGKINTNNNRRQVGPLQAIAPGPAQAIVFRWRLPGEVSESPVHGLPRNSKIARDRREARAFGECARNLQAFELVELAS